MVRRSIGGLPPASPTDGELVVDMPWPDTKVSDVGLSPSTIYAYAVFAHGWEPNYAPAATVVVTTADVPLGVVLPDAPSIGVAVARDRRVDVSWTPPSSDGGSELRGYYITPYINGVPQWPLPVGITPLTFTVAGLTNGTTYTFRVAAKTIAGTGPPSAESNEATPAPI